MFDHNRPHFILHHGWEEGPFRKWFIRGFGPGGFGPGRFERGDLKYVILDLLKEKSRHGYDVIQELEKKFHGFYSPSPGSVYPILQLLEDQDFVTSNQQSGKKVYTITDEGKKFLKENEENFKTMQTRMEHPWGEHHGAHFHELKDEVKQTMQLIFRHAADGALKDPETMKKLKLAFEHFRSEVSEIFPEDK